MKDEKNTMVFSSFDFLFRFLPIFLFVYFACPNRLRNLCLFGGSLVFYLYGVKDTPLYLVLLLASIEVNFLVGGRIGGRHHNSIRKKWLIFGVLYNLLWLILFKYSGFFAENLNRALQALGVPAALPVYHPVLPLGISFYTFQAIAYLTDVYRGEVKYEKSLIHFGVYVSMFPHLISGPILSYSSLRGELYERVTSMEQVEDGLREFTIGLGLKVLLANQLGGLWNQVGAIGYESISTPLAWMGLAAFSLQVYFDFYGYSLMAVGLGRILGLTIPQNFAHPYMSLSMTEFWRRWHITLGSWFRQYVYIPLGGNRVGKPRMLLNLLAVWLLTGFWHGADWNFILWGFLLFVLISVEKLGLGKLLERWRWLGHLYMLFVIPLSWLVFAVSDLGQLGIYFQRLLPFLAGAGERIYFAGDYLKYGRLYGISLAAGLLFMTGLPRRIYERYKTSIVSAAGLAVVFWLCVYCIKMGMDDPFLYFRF